MFKLSVTIIVIATLVTIGHGKPAIEPGIDCSAELKKADKCLGAIIVVGEEKIPMFTTVKEFEDLYCNEIKSRIKCAQGYKKCLKAFPRTVYSVAVNGLRKIGAICKTKEKKQELIDYFACFPPMNSTELLTRIGNRVTLAMNHVLTVDTNDMIPTLCCSYHSVMRQLKEKVDDTCSKSKEGTGKYFVDLVGGALNDPVELVCGAYGSYDVCMQKIPEQMVAITNATNWDLTKQFVSTPIVPVIKVIEQLDKEMNI